MKRGGIFLKKNPKVKFDLDLIDEQNAVASATEYTGLIQIPPENDWERDAYCDIYTVPSGERERRKKPD